MNSKELFNKLKNDPEFKKEERFLELTEDILATLEPRLSKLEHAVCVIAQAVSKAFEPYHNITKNDTQPIMSDGTKFNQLFTPFRECYDTMNQLIADLQPIPKEKE